MLLAVDVGNSETVVGIFEEDELVHHWRLTSLPRQTGDELAVVFQTLLGTIQKAKISGMAVSSVVPELNPAYSTLGKRSFSLEPLIIDHRAVPGLRIQNHDPASVGADRLVNAVAVQALYGAPAIVVDMGTATTLDVIGGEGEYAGGIIAPGVATAASALFQRGARLARVEIKRPEKVVGRTTEESMQSGIFYGSVGAIDAMVEAVIEEQGFASSIPVVATGGLAEEIREASRTITAVDPFLTLTGIRMVWEEWIRT